MPQQEENALVPMEKTEILIAAEQEKRLFDLSPKDMVTAATQMATPLADVINKQLLFTDIQGKKYVKCEGWQLLGSMLGITPKETKVIEHEDGSFEAHVDLINIRTSCPVGGASSICGTDEKRWSKADKYARRSMAVTRATGKAYRLAFSWIMNLAGYEPTPAEEMPYPGAMTEKTRVPFDEIEKDIHDLLSAIDDKQVTDKSMAYFMQHQGDFQRLDLLKKRLQKKLGEKNK